MHTMPLYDVMDILGDTGNGLRIGLDDYPIFDEAYRPELNQKIIGRYLNREIGHESIPQFTHQLRQKMLEIMPYYNEMYRSKLIEFNPLDTFRLTTTRNDKSVENGTNGSSSTSKVTTTSGSRNITSDTPEVMLSDDTDYATTGADANSLAETDTSSSNSGSTGNVSNLDGSTTTTGTQGSLADQLQKFRATIVNIDTSVLFDLNELFFSVRTRGDQGENTLLPSIYRRIVGMGTY